MTPQNNFRPWAKALQSLCLKKLNDFGGSGTAKQIAENINRDIGLISPRMTELAEMGVIRDSSKRISEGRGRPQVVWEVVDFACDSAQDCDDSRDTAPVTNQDEPEAPDWFKRFGM